MLDDQTEIQLVPKLLLQVSVRELHNSLVSDPNDGGLKDARDENGKIIISDSTLCSLSPPKLNQMSARYKIICGSECCISAKSINSSLLSWRNRYLKKLKDKIQNAQIRRSGEKAHQIYITYKNTVMPHGRHIYAKESDMGNATHILSMIMHFHTGNVYCGAVPTVLVSILLTKKQLKKKRRNNTLN